MNIDQTNTSEYILIDSNLRPSYAKIHTARLSKYEALAKNRGFAMNRSSRRYILKDEFDLLKKKP